LLEAGLTIVEKITVSEAVTDDSVLEGGYLIYVRLKKAQIRPRLRNRLGRSLPVEDKLAGHGWWRLRLPRGERDNQPMV